MRTARGGGFSKRFSWRKRTVSPPILRVPRPVGRETRRIGGAEASASWERVSWETVGQAFRSALPAASCMAKARQVGTPHLPQLVRGSNLKISIPVSAMQTNSFVLINSLTYDGRHAQSRMIFFSQERQDLIFSSTDGLIGDFIHQIRASHFSTSLSQLFSQLFFQHPGHPG